MEETLGKRIVANRKRLGITQDRLAEQLGVTAQAVSKWENDQSCPDITMLPKLAEIFGISVDALLGCAPQKQEPVFEGEIVPAPEEDDAHRSQKNAWEVRWDSGRKNSIAMAFWVLLVGGLLLTGNLLDWDVDLWAVLWPSALLVFGLAGLVPKFSFFSLGCALFGGYFLLDNLDRLPVTLGKDMLLPVFLVLFGLSLLVEALRKPRKGKFTVTHNGKTVNKTQRNCSMEDESFVCSVSFGEDEHFINLPRLSSGAASVSFGELTVDLTGCEEIARNCRIEANCSFGDLTFLVPRCYRVDAATSSTFAAFEYEGSPMPEPQGVILMDANVSFGEITVKYI